MIVAKCPVRISLSGGSTDLEDFIQAHGAGEVISFTPNIYTYICIFEDKLGFNGLDKKYVINYSDREIVESTSGIKNDIARVCLDHYDIGPVTAWFTCDLYSAGSGLAASSSYVNAFVKALSIYRKEKMSPLEIGKIGLFLERKFNPMTGYQDPYGCALGGLKHMIFPKGESPIVENLNDDLLKDFQMFLVHTGVKRVSTNVLKSIDTQKSVPLLDIVRQMKESINKKDSEQFFKLIRAGWEIKKQTSQEIISNKSLLDLDSKISRNDSIVAHRLLGAGGGGYFLCFAHKDIPLSRIKNSMNHSIIPIEVASNGISGERI